ncbi:hypothetical protein GTQ48_02035 [Alteromonas genovensis]|uniref:Twin-arginine translocation signal domain-containing protein n=1 Tax=Alteromonas genovensis TaxID=471225 RepID=A0A6N9TE12_9ALTE|nr:hypothetical protein [Alteromonas genovensis]NDW14315.1 hypothetical protein [Alteromonas genovensis]
MNSQDNNSRRKFIKASGAIAGVTIIPSKSVWGACNASGVSGGSQALENVCRVSAEDDPSQNVSPTGFSAAQFNTVFTSMNKNPTPIPDAKARGIIGGMFTKTTWLDEDHSVTSPVHYEFPIFRYDGAFKITNIVGWNGSLMSTELKSDLKKLEGAKNANVSKVSESTLKAQFDASKFWHMGELFAVRSKLEDLADIDLVYVSGVGADGKANTSSINVLDELKNGSGVALNVAALYLNLKAGFCNGIPAGYNERTYCEHLLSVVLENVTDAGFASDLTAKIAGLFSNPLSIKASALLKVN